jgi:hypothetical protein
MYLLIFLQITPLLERLATQVTGEWSLPTMYHLMYLQSTLLNE